MGYYVGSQYVDTGGSWVPVGGGAYGYMPSYNHSNTNAGATGGPGNLTGTTPSNWTAPYGGTPSVPDPRTTMTEAIGADIGALPNLYELASKINDFNYQQKLNQILKTDPNFQGQLNQSFKNIEAAQKGQVPQDVADVLRNKAASMGIGMGTSGSDFIDFNNLYNYGQTSLDQQRWSENALTGALGRLPTTTPFDFTGMMLSPDALQQAKAMANIYASAPNPTAANENALRAAQAGMRGGYGSMARPNVSALPTQSVAPVGTPVSMPSMVRPIQPNNPNTRPGTGTLTPVDQSSMGPSTHQMDQSNPYYGTSTMGWALPNNTPSPTASADFVDSANQAYLDNLFYGTFDYPSGEYGYNPPTASPTAPQYTFDNTYWPEDLPSPTDPYSLPGGGAIDPFYGMIMDELGNIYFDGDY